jgi:hypothetical protein
MLFVTDAPALFIPTVASREIFISFDFLFTDEIINLGFGHLPPVYYQYSSLHTKLQILFLNIIKQNTGV